MVSSLESSIERRGNQVSLAHRWIHRKFEINEGDPDHAYFKNGYMFFIEYKQLGEKPKKHQELKHKLWRKSGFNVYVVDDVNQLEEIFNYEDTCSVCSTKHRT